MKIKLSKLWSSKRIVSAVLSLTVLISSLSAVSINVSAQDIEVFSDDFESADYTNARWETEASNNIIDDFKVENGTFTSAKVSNGNLVFTTVKDGYWGDESPKQTEFVYKIPSKTPAGLISSRFALYYDVDSSGARKAIYLAQYADKDVHSFAVNGVGFYGLGASGNVEAGYGDTVKITAVYDYSGLTEKKAGEAIEYDTNGNVLEKDQLCGTFKIVISFSKLSGGIYVPAGKMTVTAKTGVSVASSAVPFNSNFKIALSSAQTDACGAIEVYSAKTVFVMSDSYFAEDFIIRYGDLLSKQDISETEYTQIKSAFSDYQALTSGAKNILISRGYADKLNSKYDAVVAAEFEDTYNSVFQFNPDNIGYSDGEALGNMFAAYGSLTDSQKALLSEGVSDKVSALKTAYSEIIGTQYGIIDDFENPEKTANIWKTNVKGNAPVVSDYTLNAEDGNTHLSTAVTDSKTDNATKVVTTFKDGVFDPDDSITAAVFTVVALPTTNVANTRVMFYYDPSGEKYFYGTFQAGKEKPTFMVGSSGFYGGGETFVLENTNYDDKLRISVSYDTSKLIMTDADDLDEAWNAQSQYVGSFLITIKIVNLTTGETVANRICDIKTGYSQKSSEVPFNTNFRIGFSAKCAGDNDYFQVDDVVVNTTNGNKNLLNRFEELYGDLIFKKTSEITAADKPQLEEALEYYSKYNLVNLAPDYLTYINEKLLALEVPARGESDLSDFTEDFENGLNRWYNLNPSIDASDIKTIVDEDGNKCLEVGDATTLIKPYDLVWPSKGTMTSYEFDVKVPGGASKISAFKTVFIFYSFVDEQNYAAIRLTSGGVALIISRDDIKETINPTAYPDGFDPTKWFHIKVDYFAGLQKASISITQKTDDGGEISINETYSYFLNGGIAFGYYSKYNTMKGASPYIGVPVLYDNIKVSFAQGDWDDDIETTEIIAYYTGNTFLKPGDSVQISGEKLNQTVGAIKIAKLDDNSGEIPSNITETKYDGVTQGNAVCTVNWDSVEETKIIQRSKNNINFIIPENLEKGVYAVQLIGKNSRIQNVVLYLNEPDITFVQGNEGANASSDGWLRIIGENLAPTGNADDIKVVLENTETGARTTFKPEIKEDDSFSLALNDLSELAIGNYKVSVYNGYGDSTAWSAPMTFGIVKSHREVWPQQVFNVKDYGAVGDGHINDTPAIIKALSDIDKNNGGILYLPTGAYRLISAIAIPEKTVIMGDGHGNSTILWTAENWQYGELPKSLISFTKEVEICNISLVGCRYYNLFQNYKTYNGYEIDPEQNRDMYFHDLYISFGPYEGTASSGGGSAFECGRLNAGEVKLLIDTERQGMGQFKLYGENIQMYNMKLVLDTPSTVAAAGGGSYMIIKGNYEYFNNINFPGLSVFCQGGGYACILENCEAESAFNSAAKGFYFANNYMHDVTVNNREVFTFDGGLLADNLIPKATDDPLKYEITNLKPTDHKFANTLLEIARGQGAGQTVLIKDNYKEENGKYIIELCQELIIPSNRNNIWKISRVRDGCYFVNNKAENGNAFGAYCSIVNAVWYGNEFKHFGTNEYTTSNNGDHQPIWYITSANNRYLEGRYFVHGEGVFGNSGGNSHTTVAGTKANGLESIIRCFAFRENYYDYAYIYMYSQFGNATEGMIIDNNHFDNTGEYAIRIYSRFDNVECLLLRRNIYDERDSYYYSGAFSTKEQLKSSSNINKYGSYRVIVMDAFDYKTVKGDVNGDGRLTVKDCTLIRYYLIEMVELSSDQLKAADVNGDKTVNMLDIFKIRELLLGGSSGGESSSEESSSSSSSSESSSEESSSSESSSSESSSSSSSESSSSENSSSLSGTATDNSSGMLF